MRKADRQTALSQAVAQPDSFHKHDNTPESFKSVQYCLNPKERGKKKLGADSSIAKAKILRGTSGTINSLQQTNYITEDDRLTAKLLSVWPAVKMEVNKYKEHFLSGYKM